MKLFLSLCAHLFLTPNIFAIQAPVTIKDTAGRSLEVTLVSFTASTLKCKKSGSSRLLEIPLDKLDEASVALIKETLEAAQSYAAKNPPLDVDVSINKRRKGSSGSWYMKQMEITAKVKLKNKNLNIVANTFTGRMLMVGQDQRNPDIYEVLQNEEFKINPSHKGQEHLTKTVRISYDSDNKGIGNIGGSKYYGYILIIASEDGQLLTSKTTLNKIKDRITTQYIDSLTKLTVASKIDENFEPFSVSP